MKKYFHPIIAIFILLVLVGAGCGKTPSYDYEDDYDYDNSYEDTYSDDSYDSYDSYDDEADYSNIPQGIQSVYACNLDQDYCEYHTADISGDQINSSSNGSNTYFPDESLCDEEGCYFKEPYSSNEWYFEF